MSAALALEPFGVRHAVAELMAVMDQLPGADLSSLDDADLAEAVEGIAAVQARLGELQLRVARAAEQSRVAERAAASGTDAWLARLTGTSRGRMAGGLWLARMLEERYAGVREVLAAGRIDLDQARVIVRAAEKIPVPIDEAAREDVTVTLAERAARERVAPARLRRMARRMCDRISRELADEHQTALLEDEARRAAAQTYLWLGDNGDGTWALKGTIPELHGQLLATVLDHLSSPRRRDPSDANYGRTELLGQAFCELLEHLPTDGLASHGRVGATVMVHLDHQHLLDGLSAARLDSGAEITPATARRLACNAGIIPAVFGGQSLPLDVGRESRLHTKAQRAALSARHDTCAAEGCERPFAWCEIHHPDPWSQGGRTDLANAVPLCGWHHRKAHDNSFTHKRSPAGGVRFHRRR